MKRRGERVSFFRRCRNIFRIAMPQPRMLYSTVKGHNGQCRPTWLNRNQVDHITAGGVTGFFRLVNDRGFSYGPEFHGVIRAGRVYSTEIIHGEEENAAAASAPGAC